MLQTDARIQQGDSGGALANSAGQVIGMITAANTSGGQSGQPGRTLGFAIPVNTALAIAKQINERRSSSTVYIGLPGFLGVEVAPSNSANPQQQAADAQQSGRGGSFPGSGGGGGGSGGGGLECQTGGQPSSVPDQIAPASTGALIVGILCGTVAQQHNLSPGDVIISVNGHAVTTPGSLTTITSKYHPGDVVSVVWESVGGAQHTTSIRLGSGPAR
jgi:S1-C subfamily serine protease